MSVTVNNAALVLVSSIPLLNGTGPISVPGLVVGDILTLCLDGWTGVFENVVTVNDEVQQVNPANLSGYNTSSIYFIRPLSS